MGRVTGDKVVIRAGQNQNFESLGTLQKDEEVVVVAKSYEWYKIKLPIHARSYVNAQYVKEMWDSVGQASGSRVNIRAGTDTKFTAVGQLKKDDLVVIKDKVDGWLRIEPVDESYGWVAAEYLKFSSRELPAARKVELPTRNIYKRKRVADEAAKAAFTQELQNLKIISALGQIRVLGEGGGDVIQFQLTISGQPVYYLVGPAHIFEKFKEAKVTIEGGLDPELGKSFPVPVIRVTKIKLVL